MPLFAASNLSCSWHLSPFLPGRDPLHRFLLYPTGHVMLFLLTYLLCQFWLHTQFFASLYSLSCSHFCQESFKTKSNVFLMHIRQIVGYLNQSLLSFPNQTNPGCVWLKFDLHFYLIVAHWIYHLILLDIIHILLVTEMIKNVAVVEKVIAVTTGMSE